jgi:hypothetical protein
MNITLRKNTIPRVSRKTAKNVVKTINTLFGEEVVYLIKQCKKCDESYSVHNFYVKKHKQSKKDEDLSVNDFRDICIPCHDKESHSNRKSNRQVRRKFLDAIMSSPDKHLILKDSMRKLELYKEIYEEVNPPSQEKDTILFLFLDENKDG